MGDNGIMQVCNPTTTELENATVVTMTESQSLEKDPLEYSKIRIDDEIWNMRLQDVGCSKEQLHKATYRQNKIQPFGPKDNPKYYPHLSAIAVEFLKAMISEQKEGRGWSRLPKNNTDAKLRIIEWVLRSRKLGDDEKYVLDQTSVFKVFEIKWHLEQNSLQIDSNDKL